MYTPYFAFLTGSELLLVLLAVVILFGATRLPQLGQSLGEGIKNFRDAVGNKDKEPDALKEKPNDKKDSHAS